MIVSLRVYAVNSETWSFSLVTVVSRCNTRKFFSHFCYHMARQLENRVGTVRRTHLTPSQGASLMI